MAQAEIRVFPARAGMSLALPFIFVFGLSVPRASGDEPYTQEGPEST